MEGREPAKSRCHLLKTGMCLKGGKSGSILTNRWKISQRSQFLTTSIVNSVELGFHNRALRRIWDKALGEQW